MDYHEKSNKDMNRYKYDGHNLGIYSILEERKKVLDVGCATGKLGEELRKNKSCYVVGIEIDEMMARTARKRCDKVIVADIERLCELPFPPRFFDVIVFADSLEHMRQPEMVLTKLRNYLTNDGYILISIPNVAFITVRFKLLFGKFKYQEYGILDRTHLRFFTLETVKSLIEGSGYEIVRIADHNDSSMRRRYFLIKLLGKLWKSLFAIRFIIKARKCE